MLRLPSVTDTKARFVGMQMWKTEEMRLRNSFSGSQYSGRNGDKARESQSDMATATRITIEYSV